MGTRGLHGFATGDVLRASYNQYDTYPDGLGVTMFRWASAIDDFEKVKTQVLALEVVKEMDEPTPEQLARLAANTGITEPERVSTGRDWYSWLRECQGDPQRTLDSGFILDSVEFAQDSLFCEWAWVVDLDSRTLEVYKGFQTSPHSEGRFAGGARGSDGYYPIRLIDTVPLDADMTNEEFLDRISAKVAE